jgi:hypothetical protein
LGNPAHYGRALPQRCLQLIDGLWDQAEQILQAHRPELGPLTSTFLLSMSMPIINLPIERIERHRDKQERGYADDSAKDPKLSKAIFNALGGQELRRAPFYSRGSWSFCEAGIFNISDGLPAEYATTLATPEAEKKASKMPGSQWSSILRNAMAHGGIAYLDHTGHYAYEAPVGMYLFVSGKFDEIDGEEKLIGLNLLRISEANYRNFLRAWVKWLEQHGLDELMEAA